MGKYTDEPVDELPPKIGKGGKLASDYTEWSAVAAEYLKHPNKWIRLKVDRYTRCSESNAKYAMKKLRQQGLQADKREHYEEYPGVPDVNGDPRTLRNPLGVFSVWGMAYTPASKAEFHDAIQQGIDSAKNGNVTVVEDLDAFLDDVEAVA